MVYSPGVEMEVGQPVRIRRLRDRVPEDVVKRLGQVGVIRDFKMTDGSGVGLLVQFDDKGSTWFFEDEVELVR
ncbi:cytochrome b6f subunit PetP [Kovacikia minuta]|uniref:cytochrome b6f subunit PetP n=1 Tax=Kovacikia minuta TaxID=2931930 RepID=UPI0036F27DE6